MVLLDSPDLKGLVLVHYIDEIIKDRLVIKTRFRNFLHLDTVSFFVSPQLR
jgi:hypothetical protein